LPASNPAYPELAESMRYSVLNGGKRLRPILTLEFARLCGGNPEDALPFACGVELVHSYSLVHDDLPCMDDDDFRRGLPTTHKVFGEAAAVLTGDALLTLAFSFILSEGAVKTLGYEKAAKAAFELSAGAGHDGMVGGQALDIRDSDADSKDLQYLHERKTGSLIRAAARLGIIAAGGSDAQLTAADRYASSLGLAFQIVDDILDACGESGNTETVPPGGPETGEPSYVTQFGLTRAKEMAVEMTGKACDAASFFDDEGLFLRDLAKKMYERTN